MLVLHAKEGVLGKPIFEDVSNEVFKYISGKTIFFYTGVCVMDSDTL
jgi:predicted house-cleaning NTP pyrophosphatase (Maf/HAM1 superfamily)